MKISKINSHKKVGSNISSIHGTISLGTSTNFEAACLPVDDDCRIASKRKPIFLCLSWEERRTIWDLNEWT